jgi:type II secretory pathway component PulJ
VGNRAHFSLLPAALALTLGAPVSLAQSQLLQTSSRNIRLQADSTEISQRARDLQARFERRRRQMLPKFYVGTADHCLMNGIPTSVTT